MSKNYYNGVYEDGTGNLLDVICYHSDHESDSLVRACRDEDAKPYSWHDGVHLRKLSPREAMRAARQLFGLRKYERLGYGEIAFVNTHTWSSWIFAASPEIVTHW